MFALCLFRNGVGQKWSQTRQAVSIPAYILDDGAWKVRQPRKQKVRNSQIFCYGNAEFLGCNEKTNRPHWSAVKPVDDVDENREKIKSIVKTVIFCGQNNIPLRGKRDDNPDNSNLQGNFQARLEFSIDSGDVKFKEHLENFNK